MEGEQVQTQYDPQLIEAVRKQIEYYFSVENLQNDVYLTQQMDANRSVPISVVMKFAKLKALTQDESVVRQALVDSTVTIVDNRIKANIKTAGRSTIILRDVPSDASEESVKEIFNYPGSKPIVSVRSDIGDTWFVVLETEQDAKDTLLDLKLKKRMFNGQPVKARIKTENVVRSYYPVPTIPPIAPVYPVMPYPGMVPAPIEMVPYGYLPVGPVDAATVPPEAPVETALTEAQEKPVEDENNLDANKVANRSAASRDPRAARPARTVPPRDSAVVDRRGRGEGRRTGGEGRNPSGKDREKKVETSAKPPIEINSLTFPPLHVADDTPVPTPGYKEDYRKYNMDEIINIVKEVKEAALPTEVDAEAHSLAITATPNLDLLKRQRTFSIDETREQLRQGRPVLKDAIIPGAVDYRSMMYGDDSQAGKQLAMKKSETDKKVEPASSSAGSEQPIPMETGSQSPARFSSSTWAAMVKSAAADPAPVATLPVKTPAKSIDSSKKQPQSTAKAPAEKVPSSNGNNNKKEKTEGKVEKKGSNKAKDDKKKEKDADEKKNDQESKQDNDATTEASAVSWGGKASFANVLKQKLAEEPTQSAAPVAAKPTKPVDQGKSNDHGKSKGSNNSSGGRSKDNKRTSNADADGMWVKETLPALEK